MPKQYVKIEGAPGYSDFTGVLIPGLHEVAYHEDAEPRSVVLIGNSEPVAIPSKHVTLLPTDTVHAERYRNYWSTVSGRRASDVYIPEALR